MLTYQLLMPQVGGYLSQIFIKTTKNLISQPCLSDFQGNTVDLLEYCSQARILDPQTSHKPVQHIKQINKENLSPF